MGKRKNRKPNRTAKNKARKNIRRRVRKNRKATQTKGPRKIFRGMSQKSLRTAEIYGAFMSPDIFEVGLGPVIISRCMPFDDIAFGMFLIDADCLGVKNAHFDIGSKKAVDDYIADIGGPRGMARVDPARARKLVEDAVCYAGNLGFHPHEDFRDAVVILGDIDTSNCNETFEFGKDGKPFYVAGPDDSPAMVNRVLSKLEEGCGPGGYHFLIEPYPSDGVDENWEYEDEDEDELLLESGIDEYEKDRIIEGEFEVGEEVENIASFPVQTSMDGLLAQAEWGRLYALAMQIKETEPWRFFEEDDLFGVQFPGSEEVGYVSITGSLDEHLRITVYLGVETINTFFDLQASDPNSFDYSRILEMRQLMLSFSDREELESRDLEVIRHLGLKFHGKKAWPLFRSYLPGYVPWQLDIDEIALLAVVLEQTMEVVGKVRKDADFIPREPCAGGDCLVRVSSKSFAELIWKDDIQSFPWPAFPKETFDKEIAGNFLNLSGDRVKVEMDFLLLPGTVGLPDERPYFSYALIAVDVENEAILGFELLQALNGVSEMWNEIPQAAYSICERAGVRPDCVHVAEPRLQAAIEPTMKAAGVSVALFPDLPVLSAIKESLLESFS